MTVTEKLRMRRSVATLVMAAVIAFLSESTFLGTAAVLAGLVLGGIQGASACGIALLVTAIKAGGTVDFFDLHWEIFLASLAAGLISKVPSETELKATAKMKARHGLKIFTAALAGYLVLILSVVFRNSSLNVHALEEILDSITLEAIKFTSSIVLSLALRPVIARLLYPLNLASQELDEILGGK